MSAACVCPDVQVDVRHPIPTGPLTCACCGQPIIITCAGRCGEPHVRASFAAAAKAMRPPKPRTRRAVEAARAAERASGADVEPMMRVVHQCKRCGEVIPPARGRPREVCDRCLTPEERQRIVHVRRYLAKKAARLAAASATASATASAATSVAEVSGAA